MGKGTLFPIWDLRLMTLINTEAKADLVCSEGPAAGEEDGKDKHHAILYNILFRKYQAHVI